MLLGGVLGLHLGKSKWGLSNGGLRPLSAICAQVSTIVHFCGLLGPFSKGNFRHKMTTIIGNRGPIVEKYLKPPFAEPPFRLSRSVGRGPCRGFRKEVSFDATRMCCFWALMVGRQAQDAKFGLSLRQRAIPPPACS